MTRSLNQEMAQAAEISKTPKLSEVEDVEENLQEELEGSKIVTTEEELEAFDKIKMIAETSTNYKLEVKYKDTISYFGLNLGKTTWWFLRLYLSSQKKILVTRLFVDEAQSLAPDFQVHEVPSQLGDTASKIMISDISDLDKLVPLILRCYELEAAKH